MQPASFIITVEIKLRQFFVPTKQRGRYGWLNILRMGRGEKAVHLFELLVL